MNQYNKFSRDEERLSFEGGRWVIVLWWGYWTANAV